MKITVIHGSMRKGNTYGVVSAVLERLHSYDDVEVSEISVADLDLPFCVSCHACFSKGEQFCPHRAIIRPVADAMENCDGLIVSGVCYAMQINAAMKNVIDHLAYYFHRPRLFTKIGMVVTTTAGAGEKTVASYLRQTMGHWGMGKAILLPIKIQTEKFTLTKKQKERIRIAADTFYRKIKEKKLASPSIASVAVHNAFRGNSSLTPPLSECDGAYWKASGFIQKIYPRRVGLLKLFVGRITYSMMRSLFGKIVDNREYENNAN